MDIWTLTTSGDYPLGRNGTFNSAVNLYNLIENLLDAGDFFILEDLERGFSEDYPQEDFELTPTAKLAYSLLLDQFYIRDINEPAGKVSKTSLHCVKENLKTVHPFLAKDKGKQSK